MLILRLHIISHTSPFQKLTCVKVVHVKMEDLVRMSGANSSVHAQGDFQEKPVKQVGS